MSRISLKRLLLLALALVAACVPAVSHAQQNIIDAEALTPEEVNYRTETVATGVFEKTTSQAAVEYYPLTYSVSFDNGNAKFVEFTVARGDEVKKGDVLARFEITGSDVQMTSMELSLRRLEEATAEGILDREEAIAEARAVLSSENDQYEKEKKQLTLRKMEIELEQYRYRQQYSIERQRAELEEEVARREENVLLAPIDGVITDLTLKKVDDAVFPNEALLTISSQSVMLLRVDNSDCGLRYNMQVDVVSGNNNQRVELTGRVVAADDSIPEKERTGWALILLDPYEADVKLRTIKVTGPTIRVENVSVAKRSAVTMENGKYYVTKLVDGMVQKRYVDVGMLNAKEAWILNGVADGETLVID